jgi:uncharacterized protein (TIRG00374 family)
LLLSADRVAMGLKWRHLINGVGAKIRAADAIAAYYQSGFAALLLPTSAGGEVIRGLLGYRSGVPGDAVVASMVLEKVIAAVSNLTWAAVGISYLVIAKHYRASGLLVSLWGASLLIIAVGLAAVGSRRLHHEAGRLLRYLAPHRVLQLFNKLSAKVVVYRYRPRLLRANLLFNLAEHLLQFFILYVLAIGLGVGLDVLTFLAATAVIMMVKRTAGFLESWGLAEGAVIVLYTLFSVPRELSVALGLTLWGTSVVAALPGAYLLHRTKLGFAAGTMRPKARTEVEPRADLQLGPLE